MKNEDILKTIQENHEDNIPDEMEKHQILKSTRTLSLTFLAIITVTFVLNLIYKNTTGIAENIGLLFITVGVSDYCLDKKRNNKSRKILDAIIIGVGVFFYIGFIGMLMGK